MRKSLSKKEIIREKRDIDRVFQEGKKTSLPGIRLCYVRNNLAYNRIFVTLMRKFGNAVERNRAKRVLKEAYRQKKEDLPHGWDFAFVIYRCDGSFSFFEQINNLEKLFTKNSLFRGN